MKRDQARQFLAQALAELLLARAHLDYSFQQVAGLPDDLTGATPAGNKNPSWTQFATA